MTDDPIGARRSYLQRAEVRLSTMHRIASSFVGGAALLTLLPLLLKEAFSPLAPSVAHALGGGVTIVKLLDVLPIFIALLIPLAALYVLLKEVVLFYFSATISEPRPLQDTHVFHPRFSLTAIPTSSDDLSDVKKATRALQFKSPLKFLILPHQEGDKQWHDKLLTTRDGDRIALPKSEWLDETDKKSDDFDRIRLVFGLAGSYDRTLIDEIALMEVTLVRHNLLLRRLVLRYMKALLIVMWTGLIVLIAIPALRDGLAEEFIVSAAGKAFLIWSIFAPFFVRSPVRWIYGEFDQNSADVATRDPHLIDFERIILFSCLAATSISTVSFLIKANNPWALFGLVGIAMNLISVLRTFDLLNRRLFRPF